MATTSPRLVDGPTQTGPYKAVADVELATLGWVHWHNTTRLHGYLHDLPPAESEATTYATKTDRPTPGRNPIARASIRTHQNQGDSGSSGPYSTLSGAPDD